MNRGLLRSLSSASGHKGFAGLRPRIFRSRPGVVDLLSLIRRIEYAGVYARGAYLANSGGGKSWARLGDPVGLV